MLQAAIGLLARFHMLQDDHVARRLAEVASTYGTTWTATVSAELEDLGLPAPLDWVRGRVEPTSAASRKRWARRYVQEVVRPRISVRERQWLDREAAEWDCSGALTIVSIDHSAWGLGALRAWAQLRLQGRLSLGEPAGPEPIECPLCGSAGGADLAHLLLRCGQGESLWRHSVRGTCWDTLPAAHCLARFRQPEEAEDTDLAVGLARSLWVAITQASARH